MGGKKCRVCMKLGTDMTECHLKRGVRLKEVSVSGSSTLSVFFCI